MTSFRGESVHVRSAEARIPRGMRRQPAPSRFEIGLGGGGTSPARTCLHLRFPVLREDTGKSLTFALIQSLLAPLTVEFL